MIQSLRRPGFCRVFVVVGFFEFPITNDRMDDSFGYWLAGLLDGEAHFGVAKSNGCYSCKLAVTLRADDIPLLYEIQATTELGTVTLGKKTYGNSSLQARWTVYKKSECTHVVDLLEVFPLRSKKRRDFELWREAVETWNTSRGGVKFDWEPMARIAQRLKDGRAYVGIGPMA